MSMYFNEGWALAEVHAAVAKLYTKDQRRHPEGLSLRTVKRWVQNFDLHGTTHKPRPSKKLTRITRDGHWQALHHVVTNDPALYLDEIQRELKLRCGRRYSVPTIWRSLRAHGCATCCSSLSEPWLGRCSPSCGPPCKQRPATQQRVGHTQMRVP